MSFYSVREIDHARDRNNAVILVGNQVFYEQDVTSQKVEKIVHNYGGAVLFLKNGLRFAAHECWIDRR